MILSVMVSVFAAVCAFVISYGHYQHQFMDTYKPMRLALQAAAVTFLFFMAATAALPWVFRFLRFDGS